MPLVWRGIGNLGWLRDKGHFRVKLKVYRQTLAQFIMA